MEAIIVVLLIAAVVLIRLVAGGMDSDRVGRHIASTGGRLLEKHWNPFGKGWFGEKNSRIYEVRYQDGEGRIHEATCKTSLFSGVYFTEDRIVDSVSHGSQDVEKQRLVEENRRLREQLDELRDQER